MCCQDISFSKVANSHKTHGTQVHILVGLWPKLETHLHIPEKQRQIDAWQAKLRAEVHASPGSGCS